MNLRGIDLAVRAAGNQTKLAKALNKTPQAISYWQRKLGRIPAEHVPEVEKATGIPRHQLRPDLYPAPGEAA